MTTAHDPPRELRFETERRIDSRDRKELLAEHREWLRRWVGNRIDRRIQARVDASDVVQEAMLVADRKWDAYVENPKIPFHSWLCRIALGRMRALRRRHLGARKRTVSREQNAEAAGPDGSFLHLVDRLADDATSPSEALLRQACRKQVRCAMARLADTDRRVLELRFVEQHSFAEIGAILGVSSDAAKVRLYRALERVRTILPGA